MKQLSLKSFRSKLGQHDLFVFIAYVVMTCLFSFAVYFLVNTNINYYRPRWLVSISLDLFGMIICFILLNSMHIAEKINQEDQTVLLFEIMITAEFVTLFCDAISWLSFRHAGYLVLAKIVKFLYYGASVSLPYMLWLYMCKLLKMNEKFSKILNEVLFVLGIIGITVLIFNLKYGFIYVIDETTVLYHREKYYSIHLIYPALLIFVFLASLFAHKGKKEERVLLFIHALFPLIGAFVQIFYDGISITYVGNLLSMMVIYANFYVKTSLELTQTVIENKEQQTIMMISQIQPHFLYNTLTAISYLCLEDPQLAFSTVTNFSKYLRQNLDSLSKREPVTLLEELEHAKTYVAIEQVRFPDLINIVYDIQDIDFKLPALTLQPLVENAVRHGLLNKHPKGGTVWISTKFENGLHVLAVQDDGCGFEIEQVQKDGKIHVGIQNVKTRLDSFNAKISIDSTIGKGTTVIIKFPQQTTNTESQKN